MPKVLLIEDEPGLVLTLSDLLAGAGYAMEAAADGDTGEFRAMSGDFDLIILDWMLPRKSGADVCRELREAGIYTPVLMLTARGRTEDRVTGLKLGADDYLAKPFDPAELLARMEALLRRSGRRSGASGRVIRFGRIEANLERAEIFRDGERVNLAAREMELLTYLIERRDRMITREEILLNVWQYNPEVSSRTIDVHVSWLRQKLEQNPQSPAHIITVRGKGYRFNV